MKTIYLIQHTLNEENRPYTFYDIVGAYSTKEKALERLESINKSIGEGMSIYFPEEKRKGVRNKGLFDGYTYKWENSAGETMYTHFTIIETDFE